MSTKQGLVQWTPFKNTPAKSQGPIRQHWIQGPRPIVYSRVVPTCKQASPGNLPSNPSSTDRSLQLRIESGSTASSSSSLVSPSYGPSSSAVLAKARVPSASRKKKPSPLTPRRPSSPSLRKKEPTPSPQPLATDNPPAPQPPSTPRASDPQPPDTPADTMVPSKLNIVMVSPEVAPWSKVGGLGDVAKALPEALGRLGHRVMTVAPRYSCYPDIPDADVSFPIELPASILRDKGPSWGVARLFRASEAFGVDRVFVDHPIFEPERNLPPHMVYGAGYNAGDEDSDLDLRYSILCQGALAAPVLFWEDLPVTGLGSAGVLRMGGSTEALAMSTPPAQPGRMPSMTRREAPAAAPDPSVAQERLKMLEQLEVLSVAVLTHASPTPVAAPIPSTGPAPEAELPAAPAPARESSRRRAVHSAGGGGGAPTPGVTFVANDWATSLVALRLKYSVQGGQMRHKHAWAKGAWAADAAPSAEVSEAELERATREREHAARLLQLAETLESKLGNARCAFCIHNLAFQGAFTARSFPRLCLPPAALAPMVDDRHLSALLRQYDAAPTMYARYKVRQARSDPSDPAVNTAHSLYAYARGDASAVSDPELQVLLRTIHVSWLKAALEEADLVVTVSPGYAGEIVKDDEGMGLADILREKGVSGILNGIDMNEWDPMHDVHLPYDCRYTSEDVEQGKANAKRMLQKQLGLALDPSRPLVGFVGRLEDQKGLDILLSALPALMPRPEPKNYGPLLAPALPETGEDASLNPEATAGPRLVPAPVPAEEFALAAVEAGDAGAPPRTSDSPAPDFPFPQWVILGKGSQGLEALVSTVGTGFPEMAAGVVAFDVALSHLIMAACDYLIVPSRFEPCGLVQLTAMRYGTLPIVASVGGLKDSVPESVGFHMGRMGSSDPEELCHAVTQLVLVVQDALRAYGSAEFRARRARAMACEVSWSKSASTWESSLRQMMM